MRKYSAFTLLLGFLCLFASCDKEENLPELAIESADYTVSFENGVLNVQSIITFNRIPDESSDIYYDLGNGNRTGDPVTLSSGAVTLSASFTINQDANIGLLPTVTTSGTTLRSEPILVIVSENGDYWLKIKEYPIEPRTEEVIPFVLDDKVILAGLDAFDASKSIPYEIDLNTLEIQEKERMPISTYRVLGFQLGDIGYIGSCLRELTNTGSTCSGNFITYAYDLRSQEWTANTDTISDPGVFQKQQQSAFIYNGKAHLYDGSFGIIYQLDEVNQEWNFIAATEAKAGAPIAEIINGSLYVGLANPGLLYELNPETGAVINSYEYPGSVVPTFNDIYVGSFVLDNKLYIGYGEDYVFDTETKEWEEFAPTPSPRTEFFTHENTVYQISAGVNFETDEPSTFLWKYTPN